jgi:hypothetical protein
MLDINTQRPIRVQLQAMNEKYCSAVIRLPLALAFVTLNCVVCLSARGPNKL